MLPGTSVSDKPENRRSSTRHDLELPATIIVAGVEHPSFIRNLSLGGAYLDHEERLAMGTRVQVRFRVPTHEEPIQTEAQVRWTSESGVGVQFDGLRAREVWSLNKYFERFS
jgi:hypothetical protein